MVYGNIRTRGSAVPVLCTAVGLLSYRMCEPIPWLKDTTGGPGGRGRPSPPGAASPARVRGVPHATGSGAGLQGSHEGSSEIESAT